jgi:hypothetical protein
MLFVLFPVAGTGAMMGAFLGILLGLHRYVTIAAVAAGGFVGGTFMAFLAVYFGDWIKGMQELHAHPEVKYGTIVAVAVLLLLALRWLNRGYRRALAEAERQADATREPPAA